MNRWKSVCSVMVRSQSGSVHGIDTYIISISYMKGLSNSYYIVCSWTRKFWHASSGVAARSVNRISAFMNKQYSNCFSQREIILADHFYTLLQLFSSCKTSCFFSSPFRHAIKVQVCRNSAWTNFSLHELRWFFISCIARSGIPVD